MKSGRVLGKEKKNEISNGERKGDPSFKQRGGREKVDGRKKINSSVKRNDQI